MPENQVRRRRRPHLQLLQHPVLRTLRRKGHSTVEQGRGEIGKEAARYIVRRNRVLLELSRALIPSVFLTRSRSTFEYAGVESRLTY